jgi:hypothetical protein
MEEEPLGRERRTSGVPVPSGAQLRQPALRFCASRGCGMRTSAPVTRLTSVIESYGKLIAACALRMDSSFGPDMKQKARELAGNKGSFPGTGTH